MIGQSEIILQQALLLDKDERRNIAERLLETLEGDDDTISDDEWAAELNRRAEEMRLDPTMGIPWEQLRDEL